MSYTSTKPAAGRTDRPNRRALAAVARMSDSVAALTLRWVTAQREILEGTETFRFVHGRSNARLVPASDS